MAEQHVSLRPDNFSEGGGLIDDFDGKIADIRFIMTDYDGKIPSPVPCARVIFEIDGEEMEPSLYSIGGSDDFAPDESGMGIVKLKSKATLTKTSKFGMFMTSLIEAGFPLNKTEDDSIAYLIGTVGHFLRKAVEYKNMKKKSDNDREQTVLLCTKILQLPWDAEKTTAKKGGKGGKVVPKAVDEALAANIIGIIQGVLVQADGELPKKTLLSELFKNEDIKAMSADDKKAALKMASDDTWLKAQEEWTYDMGVLKMA